MEFDKCSLKSLYTSVVKKLCVILHWRVITIKLTVHRWMYLMQLYCGTYTMLIVTWWLSKCCVLSGLDFEGWQLRCTLLFTQLFASRALSCYKHDMGAPSWLNVEVLARASRLVRCSTMGALSWGYITVGSHPRILGTMSDWWRQDLCSEKAVWLLELACNVNDLTFLTSSLWQAAATTLDC